MMVYNRYPAFALALFVALVPASSLKADLTWKVESDGATGSIWTIVGASDLVLTTGNMINGLFGDVPWVAGGLGGVPNVDYHIPSAVSGTIGGVALDSDPMNHQWLGSGISGNGQDTFQVLLSAPLTSGDSLGLANSTASFTFPTIPFSSVGFASGSSASTPFANVGAQNIIIPEPAAVGVLMGLLVGAASLVRKRKDGAAMR